MIHGRLTGFVDRLVKLYLIAPMRRVVQRFLLGQQGWATGAATLEAENLIESGLGGGVGRVQTNGLGVFVAGFVQTIAPLEPREPAERDISDCETAC